MHYFLRGARHLLRHPGLWKYAAFAFATNFVVFTGLAVLLILHYHDLVGLAPDSWGKPGEIAFMILIPALAAFALVFGYTIFGNAIAGPFMDAMCERMLIQLGETLPPPPGFVPALASSIGRQFLKLLVFGSLQFGAVMLWLVPLVGGFLHSAFAFLLTCYFLGFEYLDYPLGARRLPWFDRIRYSLRHFGFTMGYGATVLLISLLPLAGYVCLPVFVAGATVKVFESDRSALRMRADSPR